MPGMARGAERATLSAALTPEKLGASAAVSFGIQIAGGGQLSAPLTAIDLRFPVDLGIATSGLGLAACPPAELQAYGPAVCPANSRMGYGSALVEVPLGPGVLTETATIALLAGPAQDGYLTLLVCATGESPIAARIVLPTLLLPGDLHFSVPLIPSVPGAQDVAVVRLRATLGGRLTYYERVHGRTVAYHPKGIVLPRRCPRGGFRFAATFDFLDGGQAHAQTAVPCPAHR
jgi:hypothetical protein